MKLIGIISRDDVINTRNYKVFSSDIVKIINNYNFIPLGIMSDKIDKIKDLIDMCDGIILPGGDYDTKDDIEIIKYLYKKNIPTLGICLGMQEMAIALGGNFSSNHIYNHKDSMHGIIINKSSLLYKIINKDKIIVNSRHKNYIDKTNMYVGSISDDGIIEEVEDKNKKFFIGVQWHPESLYNDTNSKLLFDYFFQKIKET